MNAWLEYGLSNALLATALALVAWAVTRVCRHPKVAFIVWLLVLVRLLMPPLVGIPWRTETLAEWIPAEAPIEVSPVVSVSRHIQVPLPEPTAAPSPLPAASAPPAVSWNLPEWRTLLCALWLAGSAIWLLVAIVRIVCFRRTLLRAPLAGADLQREVETLAAAMRVRRVPTIRLVDAPLPPLVWSLTRRPAILLPRQLLDRLSAEERTTLLAHELAHLARRDHLVRLLELAALAIFWWHPVAWWARRRVERAGEECCDARVVCRFPELARAYAAALLTTVDFLSDPPTALPLGTSGISQLRQLQRRLEMILRGPASRRVTWPLRIALATLSLIVLPPFFHSVEAVAQKPFVPKSGSIEERLERLEKALQELTQTLKDVHAANQEDAPPKVVKTVPADGDKDVDPNLTEIKVTFSKDMHDGTWSWTQRSDDTFPEVTGKPHYIDKRTCVLPVKLQPGKSYHISINSQRFQNFKDEGRRAAIPYPLDFTTKP